MPDALQIATQLTIAGTTDTVIAVTIVASEAHAADTVETADTPANKNAAATTVNIIHIPTAGTKAATTVTVTITSVGPNTSTIVKIKTV